MERLNNIKKAYDKAEDEGVKVVWKNKWYNLVREIAKKIPSVDAARMTH